MKRYLVNANPNWFQKWLLFGKLMSNTPRAIMINANCPLSRAGTLLYADVADLEIETYKSENTLKPKYLVTAQHHRFVYWGWMAKKIFNHVQSALQR